MPGVAPRDGKQSVLSPASARRKLFKKTAPRTVTRVVLSANRAPGAKPPVSDRRCQQCPATGPQRRAEPLPARNRTPALGGLVMNEAAIRRLENSFALLAPRGRELVDRFYGELFARYPGLRSLFPDDMTGQKKKWLAALATIVANLRTPEKLRAGLIGLGRQHATYGVKPEHYPAARDTLVDVMQDMAGKTWNDQLTEDWKAAIDFVASVMLEGQRIEAGVTT